MATTAEAYGFGARAPYATPRASDWEMKERVRLSGLFPRVRNEPLSKQLQALLKEFDKNAALTGILERRRRLDERLQYELQGREGIDALNRNLAPPFRAGLASAAVSADVANRLALSQEPGKLAAPTNKNPAAQAATAVPGTYSVGNSESSGVVRSSEASGEVVLDDRFAVAKAATSDAKTVISDVKVKKTRSRSKPKSS